MSTDIRSSERLELLMLLVSSAIDIGDQGPVAEIRVHGTQA